MIRTFLALNFILLAAPAALYAAEQSLLPAICEQVITPDLNKSFSQIVIDHVVTRVKEIPREIVKDVEEVGDKFVAALSEKLEESKNVPSSKISSDKLAANVLGVSTELGWFDRAYDGAVGVLQTLLKHWVWTMAGLGTLLGYFLLRF